jgi:hypothetical protein
MKKAHRDINGKKIHLDDVVVIHKAEEYFSFCVEQNTSEVFYGSIGVVVEFGCVGVELFDSRGLNNTVCRLWFDCDEVEVIGKL